VTEEVELAQAFYSNARALPLRVWLFALVILAILAALSAILCMVLDDPFTFLADRGFSTACRVVNTGSLASITVSAACGPSA